MKRERSSWYSLYLMKIREKYSLTFKYSNIKSSLCLILNYKKLFRRCFSGGNKGFVVPIRNKARLVPRLSRFFVSKQRSCKQASWLGSGLARPVCSRCKPVCTFAGPEGSRCAGTQRCRATDRATARSKLVTTEPEQHAGKRRVRYKRPRRQIVFQPAAAGKRRVSGLSSPVAGSRKAPTSAIFHRAFTPPRLVVRLSVGTSAHCFRSRAATRDHFAKENNAGE